MLNVIYQLLDEHFGSMNWYDPNNRPLVVVEEKCIKYEWGWLVQTVSKEYFETKDPTKASIGVQPLIVDLRKMIVVNLVRWPLVSVQKNLENYISENGYSSQIISPLTH